MSYRILCDAGRGDRICPGSIFISPNDSPDYAEGYGWRRSKSGKDLCPGHAQASHCGALTDRRTTCLLAPGHIGKHRNGEITWSATRDRDLSTVPEEYMGGDDGPWHA